MTCRLSKLLRMLKLGVMCTLMATALRVVSQSQTRRPVSGVCTSRERKQTMVAACDALTDKNTSYQAIEQRVLHNIFVDDTHQVMGCFIAKVACTTWKYVMINATGKVDNVKYNLVHNRDYMRKYGLRVLSDFSPDEREHRLKSYFKFSVVRHPFDRLLSAYREKFGGTNTFYNKAMGRKIIRLHRERPTQTALELGNDVKFSEFVAYITSNEPGVLTNDHWRRYWEVCDPCRVKYDMVAKLETLPADAKTILRRLALGDSLQVPQFNAKKKTTGDTTVQGKQLAAFANLTGRQVDSLMDIYGFDMKLFGYDWRSGYFAGCRSENQCC